MSADSGGNGRVVPNDSLQNARPEPSDPDAHDNDETDEEEDEEEEEAEPKLKYERLTGTIASVYRNGDATSCFLVAADKMIIGTHNGNINVLSMPTFQTLRSYHAHSASTTAISVSPWPIPLPTPAEILNQHLDEESATKSSGSSTTSQGALQPPRISPIPANSIFIATASMDGHVCVSSLLDPKDVTLRNFARPVQAVALSPEYKNDRSYLSGGRAGELILTTGGRPGASANANTNSTAAAASTWLGSIGLGSHAGRDTILHSGEGGISVIKWSLSGKFVVWANEQGFKVMRTNLHLESSDSGFAWKRIAHVDRPNRRGWEEMASVWKARAEWTDVDQTEVDDVGQVSGSCQDQTPEAREARISVRPTHKSRKSQAPEKLIVGWGDTAWILNVHPGGAGSGKDVGERNNGRADIVHQLRFDDCSICGLTLYTPSVLLVLAYRTRDDDDNPITRPTDTSPRKGVQHRQNGVSPEVRLIDITTKEEVDMDTLTVSRYQTLSASDYNLSTLYVPRLSPTATQSQRGALGALGGGLWDAGVQATRIFSSGGSVKSLPRSGELDRGAHPTSSNIQKPPVISKRLLDSNPSTLTPGLKIFISSPYDCVLALKRSLVDHFVWLEVQGKFKDAWELVDEHPDVVAALPDKQSDSAPSTPRQSQQSLAEFFDDETTSQTTASASKSKYTAAEKEKRRIGELWLEQLLFPKHPSQRKDWATAGEVAGRVLSTSQQWEKWVWIFTQAGRFDEIAPQVPCRRMRPPLPSIIYELILGHYIRRDPRRFRDLLDRWAMDLFEIGSITSAVEEHLKTGEVAEDTVEGGEIGRDWRILLDGLAKLYLADGRPKEALHSYIRIQDADATMTIIRDHHLLPAVADDIPGFLLLRISKDQLESSSLADLEESSSEGVHLLVDEAFRGVVPPSVVVRQLERRGKAFSPLLFFYLRALWSGQGSEIKITSPQDVIMDGGDDFASKFGDLAVEMFAEYDRPLFMDFLKSTQMYRFEKAAAVCEARDFIPELVFVLSKTGQTKRALFLIIDKLGDVSQAIRFAKDQDDQDLWDNLLDYSMDKPHFIRGLLEEVGTSIDPITLVRRIPEGLEIEGLREGIGRMVREYEIQYSISEGVARVLRGEVASGMDQLRTGQKRGVKFDLVEEEEPLRFEVLTEPANGSEDGGLGSGLSREVSEAQQGHCVNCGKPFPDDETDTLIGFACGHIFHLECILVATSSTRTDSGTAALKLRDRFAADALSSGGSLLGRSVATKVDHAHIVRNAIRGGCVRCHA